MGGELKRSKRKWHEPCCSQCGHPGFSVAKEWYIKPLFVCDRNPKHSWACGRDGGIYMQALAGEEESGG